MSDQVIVKSLLAFYINVGHLPPYQAESFLYRLKDELLKGKSSTWKLPDDVGAMFIPVRPPQDSKIEYIALDAPSREALEEFRKLREELTRTYSEVLLDMKPPKIRRGFFGTIRFWFKCLFP